MRGRRRAGTSPGTGVSSAELTEYVGQWIAELELADIGEDVRALAVDHVLDGYGVGLSGQVESSHRILREELASGNGRPEAHALGTPLRLPAADAAMLNGLAIHAMDFDDTQLSTNPESVYGLLTHPTAPVLAAAAAVADVIDASGPELLTAYIAGVEVACRLADAINPRHYRAGFHSTGTVGALGAAAGVSKILGLSTGAVRTALGIAAGLAGGLRENFGTMAKPLHAGNAARIGVLAPRLAARGFTAANAILEAPRGFYSAAADGYEPARIVGLLGSPFFFVEPGISIKPYPSGSLSHPGQDAVLALVEEHDVRPDQVDAAIATTNSAMPTALIYAMPQTALEAKFSFPFFLAAAIVRGKVGIEEFSDDVVRSPEIQEMMTRCKHESSADLDALGFDNMTTRIQIRLKDGRLLERTESFALGHPRKPMTAAQLDAKFRQCASLALPPEQLDGLIAQIRGIENVVRVRSLHRAMSR